MTPIPGRIRSADRRTSGSDVPSASRTIMLLYPQSFALAAASVMSAMPIPFPRRQTTIGMHESDAA